MERPDCKIAVTSLSPNSSAKLPKFLEQSLGPGVKVQQVYPKVNKWRCYFYLLKTFKPSRKLWKDSFERESEHTLKSWEIFSEELANDLRVIESAHLIQVGLHFNSFPKDYGGTRCLYLHGTLSMILNSRFDCRMWCPPSSEIDSWLRNEQEVFDQADRVYLGAHFLHDHILKHYNVDVNKLIFVGTGIPPFPEISENDRKIGKPREPSFLFVGKDFERKGGKNLLEAFEHVILKNSLAKLYIVGPKKIAGKLPKNVVFIGRLNDRMLMQRLFLESWFFVLPTLHDSFGFAFLEAMNYGLPCIGTNIFAIPEIIKDGKTGIIVPLGDVDALTSAMLFLIENRSKAEEMGLQARKKSMRFCWKQVGKLILEDLKICPYK